MADVQRFLAALGRRVRQVRKASGLTQEQLAQRTGLSAKYISEIENAAVNPSVGVVFAIATDGLDASMATILSFDVDVEEVRAIERRVAELLVRQTPPARERGLRALEAFFGPVVTNRTRE